MSKQRKTLKIVSLVLLAWGIVQIPLMIARLMGGFDSLTSRALLVDYILNLLAAFTVGWGGVQAANRPSQAGSLVRISAIILAIVVACVIVWAVFYTKVLDPITNAVLVALVSITLVALIVAHVLGRKVRAAAER